MDAISLIGALRRFEKGKLLPSTDPLDRSSAAQTRKYDLPSERPPDPAPKLSSRTVGARAGPARVYPEYAEISQLESRPRAQHVAILTPTAPSRQPAVPTDALVRYSQLLGEESERVMRESMYLNAKTSRELEKAQKLVPASFLKQYHLHNELKRKALDKMFVVCAKLRRNSKRQALLCWRQLACEKKLAICAAAAVTLGRIVRGFIARKKALQAKEDLEKSSYDVFFAKYGLTILRLQRWCRRIVAQDRRARRKQELQRAHSDSLTDAMAHEVSVLAAERFRWNDTHRRDSRPVRQSCQTSKMIGDNEIVACTTIQVYARMYLAKMEARQLRARRHREGVQARLDAPGQAQAVYFEHYGAALTIQKWFLNSPLHLSKIQERRNSIVLRVRIAKATMIQRYYRGHVGRRRAGNFRAIYVRAMIRRARAVVTIQALFRRFRARKRLSKAQLHKLDRLKHSHCLREKRLLKRCVVARRLSISFPQLVIKNIDNIVAMENATMRVQGWWKFWVQRKRIMLSVQVLQNPAAAKVTRWFRSWIWRRRITKAAGMIQKGWRLKLLKLRRRRSAATRIQTLFRRRVAIASVSVYKYNVRAAVSKLLVWARMVACIRRSRVNLVHARRRQEIRDSGRNLYEKSVRCTIVDEIWDITRKKKCSGPSEVHKLFSMNSSNGTIDMGKAQKILRDCGHLIGTKSTDITVQDVELVFTKVKSAGERKLDYIQFIDFLHELAIMKYVTKLPLDIDVDESTFRFCRKQGKAALVSKLIVEFVRRSTAFKSVEKEFGNAGVYCRGRRITIERLALIQRVARGYLARLCVRRMKDGMRNTIDSERRLKAKLMIQRFARSYLGRRFLVKLAQQMYVKCHDPDSRIPFWFNPRTGSSTWIKPSLLRDLDCGETVKLPSENERFTLLCRECEEAAATHYCDECDKAMCASCVRLLHRAAAKQCHTQVPLEMCVECEFQVPTRRCLSCGDSYCDTCFHHVHRRGRLRLHTYEWFVKPCGSCGNKAGVWCKANPDNIFSVSCTCTLCYMELNDGEKPQNHVNGVYLADYTGPSIELYRKKRDEELHRVKMEIDTKERVARIAGQKREKAAQDIQRLYRGFKCRLSYATFVSTRLEFFALRDREMPLRQEVFYKFRDFLGWAPVLKSDTPKERVLKMYPRFLHDTVVDCFQGKWWVARQYLERLDRRKVANTQEGTKKSCAEGPRALFGLWSGHYKLRKAKSLVASKEKAHELRRRQYRDARSAGNVSDTKKKRLQKLAHDELNNAERARLKLEECEFSLDEMRMRWEIFAGPRGIQRMISSRRRHGIALPFSVSLVKGCRYALVRAVPPENCLRDEFFTNGAPSLTMDGEVRWSKYLARGDTVRIKGAYYKIISGDSFLTAYDDSNEIDSEIVNMRSDGADNDESEDSLDEEGSKSNLHFECKKIVREAGGIFMTSRVEELVPLGKLDLFIKLSRLWVLDSCEHVEICKITKKPPHTRIPFEISQRLRCTAMAQVSVACTVLFLNKLSRFLCTLANMMDDEGSLGSTVNAKAAIVSDVQNSVLKMSSTPINTNNHGYTIRMIEKAVKAVGKTAIAGIQYIQDEYRKYREHIDIDPFDLWDTSGDKDEVVCFIEADSGAREEIGSFSMDLDAPCSIMRTYLQKKFREELNGFTGDSFLFFGVIDDSETILERDAEESTESRVYVELKIDADSEHRTHTVLIMRDKAAEIVHIPEFVHRRVIDNDESGAVEPVLNEKMSMHHM